MTEAVRSAAMTTPRIPILVAALVLAGACGAASPSTSDAGGQSRARAGSEPPVAPVSAEAHKGPWTSFGDGTYEVGGGDGQVPAGKYKGTVPADSFGCYYARLKDTSGGVDAIIANDVANKGEPVIVTIRAGDNAFNTAGCGTWAKA